MVDDIHNKNYQLILNPILKHIGSYVHTSLVRFRRTFKLISNQNRFRCGRERHKENDFGNKNTNSPLSCLGTNKLGSNEQTALSQRYLQTGKLTLN